MLSIYSPLNSAKLGASKKENIMSILDIKVARCELAKDYVFLDETQEQCAKEHCCPAGTKCPLDNCFAKLSGVLNPEEDFKID